MSWKFMQEICNLDSAVPHAVMIFATRAYPEIRMKKICRYLIHHNCKCMYLVGPYAGAWYDACTAVNLSVYPKEVFSRIVLFGGPEEMNLDYSRLMERFAYTAEHVYGEPVVKTYILFEAKDGLPEQADLPPMYNGRNMDITNHILTSWGIYPGDPPLDPAEDVFLSVPDYSGA